VLIRTEQQTFRLISAEVNLVDKTIASREHAARCVCSWGEEHDIVCECYLAQEPATNIAAYPLGAQRR
jgi:hypothetical protein